MKPRFYKKEDFHFLYNSIQLHAYSIGRHRQNDMMKFDEVSCKTGPEKYIVIS